MTRVLAAELAFAAQCELAEGPVWDAARGLLRWVDILPGHVHALDPVTGSHTWSRSATVLVQRRPGHRRD